MGDTYQYHVTMLVSGEQEDAIKLMFHDKDWPCCLNVLSDETVADIIQSGFTDVFPVPAESMDGRLRCYEIKSEIVNSDAEEISADEPLDLHITLKAPNISDKEDSASDGTIDNSFTMSESESPDKSNASTGTDNGKMVRKRHNRISFTDKTSDGQVKIKKKFKCLHCDMSLASKPSLLRHCQRRHQDVWCEFKCKDCSCMFKTKEELWAHRNEVKHEPPKVKPKFSEKKNHSPEELAEMGHVKCNACGKYLPSKRLLRRHFYSDHRELMPDPICAVCNMEFKTRQELWKHKREMKHNDSLTLLDTYQCDNCGKILTGGYHSFKLHQKYVCEKEQDAENIRAVPCDICGTAFKSDEHLRRHKQIVHEKSPEICDICGTVFKNRHSVTRHKRRHNEKNRKHLCSECGKAFFTGLLLTDHMRTHTKEKPWKCPLCNHTCAIKQNLQKHALNVHKVQLKAADLVPLTAIDLSQTNEKKCDRQRIEAPNIPATMNVSYRHDDAEIQEDKPTFITMQTRSEKRQESVPAVSTINKQHGNMRLVNENASLKCDGTSSSSSYMELMIAGIDPVQYQHQWGNPTC